MDILLDFEKDKVEVNFEVDERTKEATYKVEVFANLPGSSNKVKVSTSEAFPVKKGQVNIWNVVVDCVYYNKAAKKVVESVFLPNRIQFSFKLLLGEKAIDVQNICDVSFVRYIAQLMDIKGWKNGAALQRIWFNGAVNENKKNVDPRIGAITWEWITVESAEFNEEYMRFKDETMIALSRSTVMGYNKPQRSLRGEIERMISERLTTLPNATNTSTSFGVTAETIISHRGEKVPLFEKYYFYSKAFSGPLDVGKHYLRDGIDDFIAAIANCNIHVYAKGKLNYKAASALFNAYIEVEVTHLVFYVKDAFDFVDDDPKEPSQPLGFWKVSDDVANVEVERSFIMNPPEKQYYKITNETYRDYRSRHRKGHDFFVYSTVHEEPVNLKFTY